MKKAKKKSVVDLGHFVEYTPTSSEWVNAGAEFNKKTAKKVNKDWIEFWAPILVKNGNIDLEQLKKELYDYHRLIKLVTECYDELTCGRFSKPFTDPKVIIQTVQDLQEKL